MTFVVYATYSVAIGVFIFWFGVWMLHLIAITYGKIRLHKKSRLHQKLHQHNLLQPRSRTNSSKSSHYDDLLLLHNTNNNNYHNLHQLMHSSQSHHGPTLLTKGAAANDSECGGVGTGTGFPFLKGMPSIGHNKSKSSCDYNSIIGGGSGLGGGAETIINLNCEESKDRHSAATTSPNSSATSSGISSSASSPDLTLAVGLATSNGASGALAVATMPPAAVAAGVDPQMALLAGDNGNSSASSSAGDPLLRKSAVEMASRLPKVSILKPLMGIDTNLAANLETFFTMDYPRQSYEILFCVESADDPVLGLCQSLIEKYKGEVDARLFIGGEQVGVNPKINNMEPGYRDSKYELIMISDAGIKMKPDTLIDMVEHMTEKVALVHQMPFTCDREGFAATYEKIFFGTIQSRIYLVSDCLNVICHTGMSCLMRKKVLEGVGGLRAFGCYLAEDFFMAKSITEDGWKTTISSYPALQNSGVCDIKTFQNRLVRWAKLRIAMISYLVLLEPMSECMIVGAIASWSVSILFHWDFLAFYLIHILCWFLSDWMLLTIVQNGSVSFNKFDFVVGWLFRELSAPYLFFCAVWNPSIRWRTRIYKLDWGGVANEISTSNKIKT